MTAPARAAVFDVDGTLIDKDSMWTFLARAGRWRAVRGALAAVVARDGRDGRKAALLAPVLAGRSRVDLGAIGGAAAAHVLDHHPRRDALDALEAHRRRGARIVLASASLDVWIEPIGALLRVDDVVCTRTEFDGAGRATGAFAGANCRREVKRDRVAALLGGPDGVVAYGDSDDDLPMLRWAERGVRIRPHGLVESTDGSEEPRP